MEHEFRLRFTGRPDDMTPEDFRENVYMAIGFVLQHEDDEIVLAAKQLYGAELVTVISKTLDRKRIEELIDRVDYIERAANTTTQPTTLWEKRLDIRHIPQPTRSSSLKETHIFEVEMYNPVCFQNTINKLHSQIYTAGCAPEDIWLTHTGNATSAKLSLTICSPLSACKIFGFLQQDRNVRTISGGTIEKPMHYNRDQSAKILSFTRGQHP